jgi:hypothetical protein
VTASSFKSNGYLLLDEAIQDFQGVLLSIHAACEPIRADEPVRRAVDGALDRADVLLASWRDRVRSAE